MRNNYIIRLLIALTCVVMLSWLIYHVTFVAIREYVPEVRANEQLFNNRNKCYDIICLGSSRMKNGLNPEIIDSITGMKSYNAGVGGSTTIEAAMILKAYLVNHRAPNVVFLSPDVIQIVSEKILTTPSSYITCVNIKPVYTTLKQCGIPMGLYDIVPFLKITEITDYYRLCAFKSMARYIFRQNNEASNNYNGFINKYLETIKREKPNAKKIGVPNKKCVEALDSIITICNQNNIKLVFVYAPEYKHYYTGNITNLKEVMNVYYSRAAKYNIPFLRYDSLDICTNPQLFKDNSHMNARGAALYSQIFASDILSKGIVHRP